MDQTLAMWAYVDEVRDAVVMSKFGHAAALGHALGRRLGRTFRERIRGGAENSSCQSMKLSSQGTFTRPDCVTYVPSHRSRQFARGGTGTQVIARGVASELDLPLVTIMRATRVIQKQAWLDDEDRIRNVRGAFEVKKSYARLWAGSPLRLNWPVRHVLLVDDVLTSGATCNEVASTLRKAGIAKVSVAVVARAVRRS